MGDFSVSTKIAGLVLLMGSILPFIPSAYVLIWGDIRATEAMFQDINKAVGHITSLKIQSITWAAWALISLAGFILLTLVLWDKGFRVLPIIACVGFTIYTITVVVEASFHFGVTSWAVKQLETDQEIPSLFYVLKRWLNFYLQILANPLATLSFLGFGITLLKAQILWPWAAWTLIIWSGLVTFYPLPLAFAAIPTLLGIALYVWK